MLIRLIYASRTKGMLTPLDVKDIVRSSQRNNVKKGISGALLLSNGIFLQCLEGDRQEVNLLYHRILNDSRHQDPAVLAIDEIEQRLYGAWAMGVLPTTQANEALFLKYSPRAEFDPYAIRPGALQLMFAELVAQARDVPA
jgi:hypothetical protein